ncbi:MAG: NAD(P)H-dependent oxidoreductase [Rhodothermales bacterium]|nr:NAD(P)H-dependent oxidoreductase [Rhodothermales bacterium]MBO6778156.1 NAD(P)H-dependent oxidoreductase [Rhodothermales bacterium]
MTILTISGSLRDGSFNTALLDAAAEELGHEARFTRFDPGSLPLYNGDLDSDEHRPESVLALGDAIREADAVLFATPEYNHVIPGVLANLLDWASRPLGGTPPLRNKPVAVIGASPGLVGTARAQDHLKFVLMTIGARPLGGAGLLVGGALSKFEEGKLVDPETRRRLRELVDRLIRQAQARLEAA